MSKRTEAKQAKLTSNYNATIRAAIENTVARILELRPGWDRTALLAVGQLYRGGGDVPGLADILATCIAEDANAKRFGA